MSLAPIYIQIRIPPHIHTIYCGVEPQDLRSESAARDMLAEPGNNLLEEEQCGGSNFLPHCPGGRLWDEVALFV